MNDILIGLGAILIAGILAQWIAWQTRFPSILILILAGFVMGPVTGFIKPDLLFGSLLMPLVSFSVAVILYEGGLNLNIRELKHIGSPVLGLITTGAAVTWGLSAAAAYFIFGFSINLAIFFGTILVVTGPTVIMPLLRQVRPSSKISQILKWEGIVIDPIGAVLAVIVFEIFMLGGIDLGADAAWQAVLKTVLYGAGIGLAGGFLLALIIRRYWLPDFLQNPVSLMMVVTVFMVSNLFQAESGLLAATTMGIFLASQKIVDIKHIVEFKENLRVLIISVLFIVLAARLPVEALHYINLKSVIFLLLLILVIRPASVFISTMFTDLKLNEKVFIAFVAPRGIVAAAVASVFEIRLEQSTGVASNFLTYYIFIMIVGTILVYGLSAAPLGRRLGIAKINPQGLLMIGAHSWARSLAAALKEEGFKVSLIDSNISNATQARVDGFDAHYGSALAENITTRIDLDDIGRLLAVTSNEEVNLLSMMKYKKEFSNKNTYRLITVKESEKPKQIAMNETRGQLLFGAMGTYENIKEKIDSGSVIKRSKMTRDFDFGKYLEIYGHETMPMFLVTKARDLLIYTMDDFKEPKEGDTLISLVQPVQKPHAPEIKPPHENNGDKQQQIS